MFFWVALVCMAAEPPAIRRDGVVNAASQRPASAGGMLSPGSLISIHGTRFGANVRANTVALQMDSGRNLSLPVVSASWEEVEVLLPQDVPVGKGKLAVSTGGMTSAAAAVEIERAAIGLFSVNGKGWGPAAPGELGALLATGGGPTPEVFVAGKAARVRRSVRQADHRIRIEYEVPAETPSGCHVPVYARSGGAVSNTVTARIGAGESACREPNGRWGSGRTAAVIASRSIRSMRAGTEQRVTDEASAVFLHSTNRSPTQPLVVEPPPGTCLTFVEQISPESAVSEAAASLFANNPQGELIDAGRVALDDGRRRVLLGNILASGGSYNRQLRGGADGVTLDQPVTISVGQPQGTVQLPVPPAFEVTLETAGQIVKRGQPLLVKWTGVEAETLTIVLFSAQAGRSAVVTNCVAEPSARSFRIPADLLMHLPKGNGLLAISAWRPAAPSDLRQAFDTFRAYSLFTREIEIQVE